MLLLVYALIKAPERGWGSPHTVGELAIAGLLLAAFVLNEARGREPLMPLSIFRIRGLAAADATQLIAFAGFYSMFFFLTLYMQNVLHWSPIEAGAAYLPVTAGLGFAATISPKLFARFGTRPVLVAGSLLSAAAIYYLSRIPVQRQLPHRPPPRPAPHVTRAGRDLRRRHRRRKRRRPRETGRARRRTAQHLTPARHRPRTRDLLRTRHRTHKRPARRPRHPPRSTRVRLLEQRYSLRASSSPPQP